MLPVNSNSIYLAADTINSLIQVIDLVHRTLLKSLKAANSFELWVLGLVLLWAMFLTPYSLVPVSINKACLASLTT